MALVLFHVVIVTASALHILLRPHRQPESRVAWLIVVLVLPYMGAAAYVLLGQTSIGRRRIVQLNTVIQNLPRPESAPGWDSAVCAATPSDLYAPLFRVSASGSGYAAIGGNRATLLPQGDAAIDAIIAEIDKARDHVHLLFYIWLNDHNGRKMAKAVKRAAERGVTCRAMVDDLGSRDFQRSTLWKDLAKTGVQTRVALPVGNPILRIFNGRIDLRNHRKIVVIDNRITFCGSQNCADPAFLPKAKYGPWVDAVMRFEGPVARQNQHLFASDWMSNGGDDLSDLLREPLPVTAPGFTAQVVGTGPTFRNSAMPEMFESLIYAARRELVITSPYFVPNAGLQAAIRAAANRGVDTTLILPARNDDFAVAAASRSYYQDLLTAGVRLFEFQPGLLHTKSLTVDGEITLIGSANMDRRSFDLNYENNILLQDRDITAAMRARQADYQAQSRPVPLSDVESWSAFQRLWNNTLAIVSPVI